MLLIRWCYLEHSEVLTADGLGLAALLIYRCLAVFPAVLLLTALAAHEVHRPYWSHHYCTLCRAFELDFGAARLAGQVFVFFAGNGMGDGGRHSACKARGGDFVEVGTSRRPQNDSTLAGRERRGNFEWIYTARTELAFHADIKVIPELAVAPCKQRWDLRLR